MYVCTNVCMYVCMYTYSIYSTPNDINYTIKILSLCMYVCMCVQRFCQSYMTELSKYIGPDVDLPGMGEGVTANEIG
jgi:hypothetical protein